MSRLVSRPLPGESPGMKRGKLDTALGVALGAALWVCVLAAFWGKVLRWLLSI